MRPALDVATISLGLAALGFGIVLLFAPTIDTQLIQPILALILAAAGTIGLLLTRRRAKKHSPQQIRN